jgi:hypothetical protein
MARLTSDMALATLGAAALLSALVLGIAAIGLSRPESIAVAESIPDPPYRLALSEDGRSVRLEGYIDFGITRELSELLETAPGVRVVIMESRGGRVAEARGLVKVIERLDLETSARGTCASACTLVFMSGRKRSLEPGARLGFHRYGLHSPLVVLMMDPAAEQEKDMAVFRRRGVDEAFLDRVSATPHDSMWFPSTRELVAAGVVDALGRPDRPGRRRR